MPQPDHAVGQHAARSDPDAAVVHEGAAALFGGEQLVGRRIEHHAGNHFPVALERDGDCELRNAVQEVGGPVERIDDPAMRAVGTLELLAFLAEEAVGRTRFQELVADDLFCLQIRLGHEIGWGPSPKPAGSAPRRNLAKATCLP
jgi:hypothetical protein